MYLFWQNIQNCIWTKHLNIKRKLLNINFTKIAIRFPIKYFIKTKLFLYKQIICLMMTKDN